MYKFTRCSTNALRCRSEVSYIQGEKLCCQFGDLFPVDGERRVEEREEPKEREKARGQSISVSSKIFSLAPLTHFIPTN